MKLYLKAATSSGTGPNGECGSGLPEDGSVPEEMTSRYTTVAAPTNHCMNLAATVNVVLYNRRAKRLR